MPINTYSTRPIAPTPLTTKITYTPSRDTQPAVLSYPRYNNPTPYSTQQGYISSHHDASHRPSAVVCAIQPPSPYTPRAYTQTPTNYTHSQVPDEGKVEDEYPSDSETVQYPRISDTELNSSKLSHPHTHQNKNKNKNPADQELKSRNLEVSLHYSLNHSHDGFPIIVPSPQKGYGSESANEGYKNIIGYKEPVCPTPSHSHSHSPSQSQYLPSTALPSRNNINTTRRSKLCLNCNDPTCVHGCWQDCAVAESFAGSNRFQGMMLGIVDGHGAGAKGAKRKGKEGKGLR